MQKIFYRGNKELTSISQLKGKTINVGTDGMGVSRLFKQILSVNGMRESDVKLQKMANTPASAALLADKIDVLVMSSASDSPLLQTLLRTPGIKLFDFVQAEAYSRRYTSGVFVLVCIAGTVNCVWWSRRLTMWQKINAKRWMNNSCVD